MPFACAANRLARATGRAGSRRSGTSTSNTARMQHRPIPVCMFAYEQHTGATIELWRDQLLRLRRAPSKLDNVA